MRSGLQSIPRSINPSPTLPNIPITVNRREQAKQSNTFPLFAQQQHSSEIKKNTNSHTQVQGVGSCPGSNKICRSTRHPFPLLSFVSQLQTFFGTRLRANPLVPVSSSRLPIPDTLALGALLFLLDHFRVVVYFAEKTFLRHNDEHL